MTASRVGNIGRRDFLLGRLRVEARSSVRERHSALFATTRVSRALPLVQDGETPLLAHVVRGACLANVSQLCTVCIERCGTRAAIHLRGLHPEIDAARCTGCGACAEACPAPECAIQMLSRPKER